MGSQDPATKCVTCEEPAVPRPPTHPVCAQQRAAADECAASLLAMQSSTSEAAVAAETERRKEADQCTASLLAKEAALSEAGRAREQDVTACETACATQTQAA